MKPVITRQLAYLTTRHINLCEDHDSDEACGYARGPVSHGRHDGVCDVCEALAAEAFESEEEVEG